jgi:hypothetical protein
MNLFANSAPSRAGVLIASASAAALLLGACSNSPSSAGSGTTGSSASSGTKSSTSGSSGSSNSGSTSTVSSSSVPFPIALGNTWIYQANISGFEHGTVTNKVVAVKPVSGGTQATVSDHDSFVSTTTDSVYVFHPDGSISYPFSQLQSGATLVSGGLTLPSAAVVASGQPTSSTVVLEIHPAGAPARRVTAHITVKGDGTATVTVPAGTYTATVVSMTEKFTVSGYRAQIVVMTWMANGVGPVQSQATLTELGHSQLVSQLKLQSFTKG